MNLEEFIKTHIESVDELRALLLFHANQNMEWDTMGAAGKLYVPPAMVAAILERLTSKGFLIVTSDPPRYRFQPQTQELKNAVEELARLDAERPVTLINMIYSRLKDIQAFAEAFKIKKPN